MTFNVKATGLRTGSLVTSVFEAEGDEPADARRERTFNFTKYVSCRRKSTVMINHGEVAKVQEVHECGPGLTLRQMDDRGGDELHGKTDQLFFGTFSSELLRFL